MTSTPVASIAPGTRPAASGSWRRLVGGAGVVLAGQLAGQGSVFVRNVIVARILTREQFGVAATYAIVVALIEMTSNLAVDRMLVQADDGDDPRLQSAAQCLQALRGVIGALFLLALAAPAARLFGVPDQTAAFRMLAGIPLLRGFMHLDIKRYHRSLRFRADVIAEAGPMLVVAIVAWPCMQAAQAPIGVLWLLLGQSALATLLSHVFAERKYTWSFDGALLKRLARFGWPLLIDGLLMFGVIQGDRVLVGTMYSMDALGLYAVAFGMTLIPSLIASRVLSSSTLPWLSQVNGDPVRFQRRARAANLGALLVALAMIAGFLVLGEWVVVVVYGEKYRVAGALIGWLAAVNAVRLARTAPVLASMALGRTRTALEANLVRTAGLVAAVVVAAQGMELVWIAIAGLAGELGAYVVALAMARRTFVQARPDAAPKRQEGIGWKSQ